jgi:hypothetical protein
MNFICKKRRVIPDLHVLLLKINIILAALNLYNYWSTLSLPEDVVRITGIISRR